MASRTTLPSALQRAWIDILWCCHVCISSCLARQEIRLIFNLYHIVFAFDNVLHVLHCLVYFGHLELLLGALCTVLMRLSNSRRHVLFTRRVASQRDPLLLQRQVFVKSVVFVDGWIIAGQFLTSSFSQIVNILPFVDDSLIHRQRADIAWCVGVHAQLI